jgi:hypothetical protein
VYPLDVATTHFKQMQMAITLPGGKFERHFLVFRPIHAGHWHCHPTESAHMDTYE